MQKDNLTVSHSSYKIVDVDDNLVGNSLARDFYNIKDIIKMMADTKRI